MLTEICHELNNWFDSLQPEYMGEHTISGGQLDIADKIQQGQYYRIRGSVFNDGVYLHDGNENLLDETFNGTVNLMAVPKEFILLADEIKAWQTKYGNIDSEAQSPFASESFGGYSYSKGQTASGNSAGTWQSVFGARLNKWRKIKL